MKSMGCVPSKSVYQLYATGWKGDDIFIGTFSTLAKAQHRVGQMHLQRGAHIDIDMIDGPAEEQKTVWVLKPVNS